MKKILIFDTSVISENIGDFIIMDSINKEIRDLFKDDMFFSSFTHDKVSKKTYKLNNSSDYSFVGGTNLLSSHMEIYNQWKINLVTTLFLKNVILMGVGWWQYQNKPDLYTKYLLRSVLHKNILHSVRDSYTKNMLKSGGINNVLNTGCPTMWVLSEKHCSMIPRQKSENVVFTITDYNKDIGNDQKLLNILLKNYKNVYFWPQGSNDLKYIKTFKSVNKINILGGNLSAYNNLLEDDISLEFVGTRLHAGIRALQKKRRTIILGIDNRAKEKASDFNLNVLMRENIDSLESMINGSMVMNIKLNIEEINKWKTQFK